MTQIPPSAPSLDRELITTLSALHPKPPASHFSYGTAGFRTTADVLDSVLFRVGLLAALRSKSLGGDAIGVMVTASHNPEHDNGVKLVDPHGEMLRASWEVYASQLANASSTSALLLLLQTLIASEQIDLSIPAIVIFGHDTRPSCPSLVKALEDGLDAMAANKVRAGLVTTPMLHYLVRCYKTVGTEEAYGEPTVEGYYKKLAEAFRSLSEGHTPLPTALTVDCANGVGAPKLAEFIASYGTSLLPFHLTNTSISTPGALNSSCGADYVKTQQRAPPGVELVPLQRYCSFDGDADRIVFYYADQEKVFHLLDGDKIAGLVAGFLIRLVKEAGLDLQVGVVQTAYANGASTEYLKNVLNVPVLCVPTGVKHLHHAATSFPIGVYFEANGHGTVLFSSSALSVLFSPTPTPSPSLLALRSLTQLINQTVGDALSDLLLIESILLHSSFATPLEWDKQYEDLPNRLVRVYVADRLLFVTEDAERRVVRPLGMQERIDKVVKGFEGGRAFVRPSGTEDCVRVYAEARGRERADALAQEVAGIVFEMAGKGDRPALFN